FPPSPCPPHTGPRQTASRGRLCAAARRRPRVSRDAPRRSSVDPRELARGFEDRAIAGATTQIAVEAVADVLLGLQLAGVAQALDRQQQTRRAIAALQRGVAYECRLELGELRRLCETLDCQDLSTVRLDGEVGARAHGSAIHEHRAAAAHLHVAGALRPGQAEPLAQEVQQELLRLDGGTHLAAVDGEHDLDPVHSCSPGMPNARPLRRSSRTHAFQYSPANPAWYLTEWIPSRRLWGIGWRG